MMNMKTSLAVLGLSLFSLCVANAQQRGPQAADSPVNYLEIQASVGNVEHARASTVEIKHVHADVGVYDPLTGLFTAPLSGQYRFSFFSEDCPAQLVTLRLLKNGEQMPAVLDQTGDGSRGMVVRLNPGDQVAMSAKFFFIHVHIRIHMHFRVHIGYIDE